MKTVKTVCPHDCPDTCSIVAQVVDDRVISTKGDPAHPFTRGALCAKVIRYSERIYSPDRLLYPLRRVGAKGEGRFERISWDEALDEITSRLKQTIQEHGSESVYCFEGSGNMGIIQMNAHSPFFISWERVKDEEICAHQLRMLDGITRLARCLVVGLNP